MKEENIKRRQKRLVVSPFGNINIELYILFILVDI